MVCVTVGKQQATAQRRITGGVNAESGALKHVKQYSAIIYYGVQL